jgi:hypothetical protein
MIDCSLPYYIYSLLYRQKEGAESEVRDFEYGW